MWISILAVVVALLLVVYFAAAVNGSNPNKVNIGKPVSSTILQEITGVSDSTLSTIATPAGTSPPAKISGSILAVGGKPEVFYLGGEFCPYCAIERWSIIMALSHFGTFHGLEYTLSGDVPEINPDTPTFTFSNATFTSNYNSFVGVEEYGRGGQTDVRQSPTTAQQTLVSQYDICAATSQNGGIPFLDIANQYAVNCGAQFRLDNLAGDNWTHVASLLNTPSSNVAQMIDGAANYLITAICKVDTQQGLTPPVCSQPYASVTLSYSPTGASPLQESLMAVPATHSKSGWTS